MTDPYDPRRAILVAQADKTKPLTGRAYRGSIGTCGLCGAELQPHEWVVTLPHGLGVAQVHCAGDAGWSIR